MGWASGGNVFDPVAKRMIEYNVTATVVTSVLAELIKGLQSRGWDTEAESLGEFCEWPAIVEAFAKCHIYRDDDHRHENFAEYRDDHVEEFPVGCGASSCAICELRFP